MILIRYSSKYDLKEDHGVAYLEDLKSEGLSSSSFKSGEIQLLFCDSSRCYPAIGSISALKELKNK